MRLKVTEWRETEERIHIAMSSGEMVFVNGDPVELKHTRPISLICHDGSQKIEYPDRVKIAAEHSRYHGERVESLHGETKRICMMVDDKIPDAAYEDLLARRKGPEAWAQIIGMVDLQLKFIDIGIPFVLVRPEDGLHPRQQAGLGDMAIVLSNRMKGIK